MKRIRADFEPVSELYLVYPEGVVEYGQHEPVYYSGLTELYNSLIELVPKNIQVKVLVKRKAVGDKLSEKFDHVQPFVCSELQSIWIRDFAGFSKGDVLVKPIYKPRYYHGDMQTADEINQTAKVLHTIMGVDMEIIPLIMDGGNLVTNGKIALITERIYSDNRKTHSKEEVRNLIQTILCVQPIIIPEMKGDTMAHVDGYVNFVDERKAIVSKYPPTWKDENKYLDSIEQILQDNGIRVIRTDEAPDETNTDKIAGIESAVGLYVNFVQLNDTLIVPIYGKGYEKTDLISLNNFGVYAKGKTTPLRCNDLARFGGILHCITFVK